MPTEGPHLNFFFWLLWIPEGSAPDHHLDSSKYKDRMPISHREAGERRRTEGTEETEGVGVNDVGRRLTGRIEGDAEPTNVCGRSGKRVIVRRLKAPVYPTGVLRNCSRSPGKSWQLK
jgi:hypothetical protein